jgi:beta-glucosidase
MARLSFPRGFLWGVATSAPQIEGGTGEGGRGESIWDRFSRRPGRIADGSTPEIACDHFHRWREDLELLRWLGVGAYRFSIAWPRVLPEGRGPVSEAGLDFYDRLVDGLHDAGILPVVTLYHWDLPQPLEDRGGWGHRGTVAAFEEYAAAVSRRLGDRVKHWVTHNEPWCIAVLGHEEGEHAPGSTDPALALRVAHHLLLSHGRAAGIIRQNASDARVGIVLNLTPATPATPDHPADLDAVRRFDGLFNRWYLDPLFRGRYPEDAVHDRVRRGHLSEGPLPFALPGDLETISTPLDFLGVNYYSRVVVRAGSDGEPVALPMGTPAERTDMGWEVYPQGLEDLLVRLHREYGPAEIFITENGAAYTDGRDGLGRIVDQRRVEFLRSHLKAAHRAIARGVPLRGYFAWSLLDNFEWAHGYEKRFGLFEVDYDSQKRTAKESAFWYRDVLAGNAVEDCATLSSDTTHLTRRIP